MSTPANRSLLCALFTLMMVFLLYGCSGGISGTGDGSIIVETDNSAGADNMPEGTADSAANLQYFPTTLASAGLTLSLTSTARQLDPALAGSSNTVTSELDSRLQSYSAAAEQIAMDLVLLEAELGTELSQCNDSGLCDTVPAAVTISSNNDDSNSSFNSLEYSRGLAGYFDYRLAYIRESGDNIELRWSEGDDYVFLYADTSTHTTYSLQERRQPTITLRQFDKAGNKLVQASLASSPSSEAITDITLEADLVDWYVKALVSEQSSVLYATNTSNSSLRREAITGESNTILSETCELPGCLWQPEHNTTTSIFEDSESTVGNFTETYIANTVNFTFVQPTRRFVVATAGNDESPVRQSVICGGTTVQEFQRVFCWTPLPIDTTDSFFFEETINTSDIVYRRIQAQ